MFEAVTKTQPRLTAGLLLKLNYELLILSVLIKRKDSGFRGIYKENRN